MGYTDSFTPPPGTLLPGRADYALFRGCNAGDVANQRVPPNVLIEAKALRTPLDACTEQLLWYITTSHMTEGVAVLTNGNEWRLYDVASLEPLAQTRVQVVDITKIAWRNTRFC